MGKVRGLEEILILVHDTEDIFGGLLANGGKNDPNMRILDMTNFGLFMQNPLLTVGQMTLRKTL